ncbi:unnamed protein product, partial [Protopolystoma xenopodis]
MHFSLTPGTTTWARESADRRNRTFNSSSSGQPIGTKAHPPEEKSSLQINQSSDPPSNPPPVAAEPLKDEAIEGVEDGQKTNKCTDAVLSELAIKSADPAVGSPLARMTVMRLTLEQRRRSIGVARHRAQLAGAQVAAKRHQAAFMRLIQSSQIRRKHSSCSTGVDNASEMLESQSPTLHSTYSGSLLSTQPPKPCSDTKSSQLLNSNNKANEMGSPDPVKAYTSTNSTPSLALRDDPVELMKPTDVNELLSWRLETLMNSEHAIPKSGILGENGWQDQVDVNGAGIPVQKNVEAELATDVDEDFSSVSTHGQELAKELPTLPPKTPIFLVTDGSPTLREALAPLPNYAQQHLQKAAGDDAFQNVSTKPSLKPCHPPRSAVDNNLIHKADAKFEEEENEVLEVEELEERGRDSSIKLCGRQLLANSEVKDHVSIHQGTSLSSVSNAIPLTSPDYNLPPVGQANLTKSQPFSLIVEPNRTRSNHTTVKAGREPRDGHPKRRSVGRPPYVSSLDLASRRGLKPGYEALSASDEWCCTDGRRALSSGQSDEREANVKEEEDRTQASSQINFAEEKYSVGHDRDDAEILYLNAKDSRLSCASPSQKHQSDAEIFAQIKQYRSNKAIISRKNHSYKAYHENFHHHRRLYQCEEQDFARHQSLQQDKKQSHQQFTQQLRLHPGRCDSKRSHEEAYE